MLTPMRFLSAPRTAGPRGEQSIRDSLTTGRFREKLRLAFNRPSGIFVAECSN